MQSLPYDGGYVGWPFVWSVRELLGGHATVPIGKKSQLHTFEVMIKRWMVERSFARMEKGRRRWRNCKQLLNTSFPFIQLLFKKLGIGLNSARTLLFLRANLVLNRGNFVQSAICMI